MWTDMIADPYFPITLVGTLAFGLGLATPLYALSYFQGTLGQNPRDLGGRAGEQPAPELQRAA